MSVYAFYIFDRHTECIYTKHWLHPSSSSHHNPSLASDNAKLIFGTIFSLRRMARQLGGADDQFLSYRTREYKLHFFETATQLKFVLLTDPRVGNMRTVLHQIWATLYVEYVVKSALVPVEHPRGRGVANELFEGGLESFMASIFPTAPPPPPPPGTTQQRIPS